MLSTLNGGFGVLCVDQQSILCACTYEWPCCDFDSHHVHPSIIGEPRATIAVVAAHSLFGAFGLPLAAGHLVNTTLMCSVQKLTLAGGTTMS